MLGSTATPGGEQYGDVSEMRDALRVNNTNLRARRHGAQRDEPVIDPHVGKLLDGKYRLDAYLSQGGMGAVYKATHVMLDKTVVVKLIKPELVTSAEIVRRFQREARAASNLNHPNIVSVYDLGQTDDGTLYIAMEFIDGPSLKDVIRKTGPMPVARIKAILLQVATALGEAHNHNIIHRDLKPHNVMLSKGPGGVEVAKLLDFGIAKTFEDGSTQLTQTGFAIGTPQYMAPEQAAGKDVTPQSDLYSLGVILYEMLTGEVPFDAPDDGRDPDQATHRAAAAAVAAQARTERLAGARGDRAAMPRQGPDEALRSAGAFAEALERRLTARPAINAAHEDSCATRTRLSQCLRPIRVDGRRTCREPPAPGRDAPVSSASPAPAPTATSAPPPIPTVLAPPAPAPIVTADGAGADSSRRSASCRVGCAAERRHAADGSRIRDAGRDCPTGASCFVEDRAVDHARRRRRSRHGCRGRAARCDSQRPGQQRPRGGASAACFGATGIARVRGCAGDRGKARCRTRADRGSSAALDACVCVRRSRPRRRPVPTPAAAARPVASATPSAASVPAVSPASAPAPAAPPGLRRTPPAAPAPAAAARPAAAPAPAPAPAAAARPEHPSVFFRCAGDQSVCGTLRSTMLASLEKGDMPFARDPARANVLLSASVEVLQDRVSRDFGTTFATRTYSVEVSAETKDGQPISMPAPKTFSFDAQFGRERLDENARVIASDVVDKVRAYWNK